MPPPPIDGADSIASPAASPAPAVPTASTGSVSLDRSLLHGIAWTGGMKWAVQLITWASTIVVARLLTPADYGLVGMAALLMGLLTLLSEAGIGLAVVTLRDLDRRQLSQINTVAVLMGFAGMMLAAAAAIPLSLFFRTPDLRAVVLVMSTGFAISAFRILPYALLQRDMRFRTLALIEGATALVMAVTMVLLAVAGFRYWTLVIGGLLSIALSTGVSLIIQPHGFARPRFREIAPALRFSWHTLMSRLSWYIYSRADFVVAGRVLGQVALGAYSFAWTLATIPVEKVTALVTRVTPAVFAAVQSDPAAMRRYLLSLSEGIAVLTFPLTFGLALVAPTFVPLVLGEQWTAMVVPLQLIAFYASVRSVSPLLPQVLTAMRRTRFNMWNSVAAAIVLPVAFVVGSRWGTAGIALAWIVAHPLILLPLASVAFRLVELRLRDYWRALWPAISASATMAVAVLLVAAATSGMTAAGSLGLQIGAGAVAYCGVFLVFHRSRLTGFIAFTRMLRREA